MNPYTDREAGITAGAIDLHTHTVYSDGSDTPRALAEKAAAIGLAAISITDHETLAALDEGQRAGAECGVEVVPGVELPAEYRGREIHILGFFVDPHSAALRALCRAATDEREQRNERIVGMLAAAGYDISMEQLRAEFPASSLGRLNICRHLADNGTVASVREGFDALLGEGCPFYLPKKRFGIAETAAAIRAAGGVPVLAHPLKYHLDEPGVEKLLDTVFSCGVRYLEAYYSEFDAAQRAWLLAEAEARGFGVTGGSDYHGTHKPHIALGSGLGDLAVPDVLLERLRLEAKRTREENELRDRPQTSEGAGML